MKKKQHIGGILLICCIFSSCSNSSNNKKGPFSIKCLEFSSLDDLTSRWDYMDNFYLEEKPILFDYQFSQISQLDTKYLLSGIDNTTEYNGHYIKEKPILFGRGVTIEYTPNFLFGFNSNNQNLNNDNISWKLVSYRNGDSWISTSEVQTYKDCIYLRNSCIRYSYRYCISNSSNQYALSVLFTTEMKTVFEENKEQILMKYLEKLNA